MNIILADKPLILLCSFTVSDTGLGHWKCSLKLIHSTGICYLGQSPDLLQWDSCSWPVLASCLVEGGGHEEGPLKVCPFLQYWSFYHLQLQLKSCAAVAFFLFTRPFIFRTTDSCFLSSLESFFRQTEKPFLKQHWIIAVGGTLMLHVNGKGGILPLKEAKQVNGRGTFGFPLQTHTTVII